MLSPSGSQELEECLASIHVGKKNEWWGEIKDVKKEGKINEN